MADIRYYTYNSKFFLSEKISTLTELLDLEQIIQHADKTFKNHEEVLSFAVVSDFSCQIVIPRYLVPTEEDYLNIIEFVKKQPKKREVYRISKGVTIGTNSLSETEIESLIAKGSEDIKVNYVPVVNPKREFVVNLYSPGSGKTTIMPIIWLYLVANNKINCLREYQLNSGTILQNFQTDSEPIRVLSDGKTFLIYNEFYTGLELKNFNENTVINFVRHENKITSVSVLESENLMTSVCENGILKLWDLSNGECLETIDIEVPVKHLLLVNASIVIGWQFGYKDNSGAWFWSGGLWIYDLNKHEYLLDLFDDEIDTYEIKPNIDRKSILCDTATGEVTSYSLSDGQMLWSTKFSENSHPNFVPCIESPHLLVYNSPNDELPGKIYLTDAKSGQIKRVFNSGHDGGYIEDLLIVKDRIIITAGFDETIRLFDIKTGQCLAVLIGHTHRVTNLLMTENDRYLISLARNGEVISWQFQWSELMLKLIENEQEKEVFRSDIPITNLG